MGLRVTKSVEAGQHLLDPELWHNRGQPAARPRLDPLDIGRPLECRVQLQHLPGINRRLAPLLVHCKRAGAPVAAAYPPMHPRGRVLRLAETPGMRAGQRGEGSGGRSGVVWWRGGWKTGVGGWWVAEEGCGAAAGCEESHLRSCLRRASRDGGIWCIGCLSTTFSGSSPPPMDGNVTGSVALQSKI